MTRAARLWHSDRMSSPSLPGPMLFRDAHCCARELHDDDIATLQAFFEANPEYFLAVNGAPPRADEARQEFDDRPPPGMPYRSVHVIGVFDAADHLAAVASVLTDLLAEHVGHIGLFIVATSLHGSGRASAIYAGLESWMRDGGAQWIRLGVVAGNARAERFWAKVGFAEVRRRTSVQTGTLTSTVRVLVKSLGERGLDDYLSRVERDRPDSTLP